MAGSQNPLLTDTGAAQPRRLRIRFKGPAPGAEAAPDYDQCLKRTLNACKSSKRTKIVGCGMQTSSDAKYVARYAKAESSNKNRTLSSNTLTSPVQEIECGETEAIQQKKFNTDTLCRLMRCDTPTKGRKRFESSLGFPTSGQLQRLKRSSAVERATSSIDDLPDLVLIEILCRLPCSNFVFQCKCVSKRWRALIADPYFIGCFEKIQSYKRTPKICTLIDRRGKEFPPEPKKSSSSPKPLLDSVLQRIKVFHRLKERPIVISTYNDLVLCGENQYDQLNYYICNAYTMQYVALPPTPSDFFGVHVGFICGKDELNGECRCIVVRILRCGKNENNAKVEIFSSETGEWRELVLSSLQYSDFQDVEQLGFPYKGMLYWMGKQSNFIGLGGFNNNSRTITSSSSSNEGGLIDHEVRFTVFEAEEESVPKRYEFLGVFEGFVRVCRFVNDSKTLHFYELKAQDMMVDGSAGKLCLRKAWVFSIPYVYCFLPCVFWNGSPPSLSMLGFDPNKTAILYLLEYNSRDIYRWNIVIGEWFRIVKGCSFRVHSLWPIELPWWPTPVPTLPQH